MKIEYYHVDAFAKGVFSGNPAGVCLIDTPLSAETMQKIASENNLSETAFVTPEKDYYNIRWFSPKNEIDLCGHATLASAHVLFRHKAFSGKSIDFHSMSGILKVETSENTIWLDFPARPPVPCSPPSALLHAFKANPVEVLEARDYMLVFDSEDIIRDAKPDMQLLGVIDKTGIIITAPGTQSDFVSRFFAPREGIPEDPVTGSSHCTLIPYWADKLGKNRLSAMQLSERGGSLLCSYMQKRVKIGGKAVTFSYGYIEI